ncbi:hypothetical protein RDI58_029683 [Solanum bulbocastanum]|uniref:Uncharacterized protein n=1 Tax=Solanum bulbocastanum TaxID=147425 RepID=A0AAN8Y063_SOLBU
MNNTSVSSQNQRVKTAKAKEVFQLIFILVVCIWYLYQIRNSQNGDFEHEDNNTMEKSEFVVNRDEEEFQANETEIENFGNEFHTFHDENGVPEDVRDVNYTKNELNYEVNTNPHLEVTSSLNGERLRGGFRN